MAQSKRLVYVAAGAATAPRPPRPAGWGVMSRMICWALLGRYCCRTCWRGAVLVALISAGGGGVGGGGRVGVVAAGGGVVAVVPVVLMPPVVPVVVEVEVVEGLVALTP